jgi:uncharacterized protein
MSDIYDGLKNTPLIEAIRSGQLDTLRELLASGAEVNEQGEQGWTPLNWAAGKGDLDMVKLLVENGADVFKIGRDQRTPYMIALAAGRVEAAKFLLQTEDQVEGRNLNRPTRRYCKAYHLRELRQFPSWNENLINGKEKKERNEDKKDDDPTFSDSDIVFLHQDYTVTQSMWHGENVIFSEVTSMWLEFCSQVLAFKVPDDLDLIVSDAMVDG